MEVITILHRLGITAKYRGYWAVQAAVALLEADEGHLSQMKDVYRRIGETEWKSGRTVEQNIRKVSQIAWERNPEYLSELAGEILNWPPTAGEFVKMIYRAVERGRRLEH